MDTTTLKKLELWFEHHAMKYPEKHENFAKAAVKAYSATSKIVGLDPENIDEMRGHHDRQKEKKKQDELNHYRSFDLSILDELGVSLEDVLALLREKEKRVAGSRSRPTISEPKRPEFLDTVIECEGNRLSFAETMRILTRKPSLSRLNERTLRNWLSILSESPDCDIPPPRKS